MEVRVIERIRELELVQFDRDNKSILFHPETLCFFRMNQRAATLVRDVRDGASEEELLRKYDITPNRLETSLAPVVAAIEKQKEWVSQADSRSLLKRRTFLPKAVLMVNNYCNLKCTYCYEHQNVFSKKAIDMPLAIARTAIDRIYDSYEGVGTWMFIGGEPTLSDEVLEFACRYTTEMAQRRGAIKPSFGMVTNGVKMTDRTLAVIREFEIQATFSLDGPKKVNDLVRIRHDNSGTFDAVVANTQRYREIFPVKLQVECTVTQAHRDAGLSMTEVLDFCANELGVEDPHIAAAGLPPGDPLNPYQSKGGIQQDFIAAAEASMDSLLGAAGSRKGGSLDTVTSMLRRLAQRDLKPTMCPAGISQIVVDAFGDIYPCWMFAGNREHAMGNVLRDDVRGPQALGVIDRIEANSKNHNPVCATCYARGVCSACIGNNHNSSGRLEDPAPEFCDTVRGMFRVVLERLAGASSDEMAAAGAVSGGLKC